MDRSDHLLAKKVCDLQRVNFEVMTLNRSRINGRLLIFRETGTLGRANQKLLL